jgi:hypothetical protein
MATDGSRFGASLSPEEFRHRLRELTTLHDADWSPYTGVSSGSAPPPPSHDDDEVMPAKDRAIIVARGPDAPSRRGCVAGLRRSCIRAELG